MKQRVSSNWSEETRDCLSPALVRTRRAFVLPFARMAVEALEVIWWDDLAREVKRRVALYESVDGPDYESLTQ